jgi:small redox-active disulfide protein 2
MDIKILGSGCANCQNLEKLTVAAVDELGLDAEIDHVTDPGEIVGWGVMSTPALVIDDEVVVSGRAPSPDRLRQLLASAGRTSADDDVDGRVIP